MRREREIQQIKKQNKITYAEAVRRINQKEGIEGRHRMTKQAMEVQEESVERKMLVEVGNIHCRSDKYDNGNQVKNRKFR